MNNQDIQNVIDAITTIKDKKKYWLVRTMGGSYYTDFINNNYISIGYDEIKLFDIAKGNTKDKTGKKILSDVVSKEYNQEKRPGYIATQLLDFTYNIKKGDTVVIPSVSSDRIAIGIVSETAVFSGKPRTQDEGECPFEKRKKIKWIKVDLRLDKLDSNLLHLKYTRRTITEIDDYTSGFIERIVSPLFIKENDAHLSLTLEKNESIKAVDLFETWLDLFQLTEDFAKQEGVEAKKNDFDIRINVQSPGIVEFISYSFIGIVILSTFVATVIGADFEANNKIFKFQFKTDGLIKNVTNFLNEKKDRKFKETLRKKVEDMKIKPEDVAKMLEQLNKKQQ